jgi:hypothetical protein
MSRLGAIGELAIGELGSSTSNAFTLTADLGTYTLSGQAVTLRIGRALTAATGSYTLVGIDAALSRDRRLACNVGTYTIAGQAAVPRADRTLTASPNTREASTVYSHVLFASLGQLAIGGSASESVSAPAVTYSTTGYDTTLRRGISMSAATGSYTSTGFDAGQRFTRAIAAAVGTYTITGRAAIGAITMPAVVGSYVLTGQEVSFLRSRKRIRGFARVGSTINARAA